MKNIKIYLIVFIVISIVTSGCFTEGKFNKQFDKGALKFPAAAAKKTRDAFPCITVSLDSSGFLKSIDDLKKLVYGDSTLFAAKEKRFKEIHDSLVKAISIDTNCLEEIDGCYRYAAEMQSKAEKSEDLINALRKQISSIKPVVQKIEDSAKINIAMSETAAAISKTAEMKDTAMKYKLLYDADHSWRISEERRQKGALVLYIPIRTIILFLIIVALFILVRSKWKLLTSFFSKIKI